MSDAWNWVDRLPRAVALVCALAALWFAWRGGVRRPRGGKPAAGHFYCAQCGYDLFGLCDNDQCPECGEGAAGMRGPVLRRSRWMLGMAGSTAALGAWVLLPVSQHAWERLKILEEFPSRALVWVHEHGPDSQQDRAMDELERRFARSDLSTALRDRLLRTALDDLPVTRQEASLDSIDHPTFFYELIDDARKGSRLSDRDNALYWGHLDLIHLTAERPKKSPDSLVLQFTAIKPILARGNNGPVRHIRLRRLFINNRDVTDNMSNPVCLSPASVRSCGIMAEGEKSEAMPHFITATTLNKGSHSDIRSIRAEFDVSVEEEGIQPQPILFHTSRCLNVRGSELDWSQLPSRRELVNRVHVPQPPFVRQFDGESP